MLSGTLDITQGASGDTAATTGGGGNAVVTYPAEAGIRHVIRAGVLWSYAATPAGGGLTIADGTATIAQIDITAAGPGFIPLAEYAGSVGKSMTVTLLDGGAGANNKVSVLGHYKR